MIKIYKVNLKKALVLQKCMKQTEPNILKIEKIMLNVNMIAVSSTWPARRGGCPGRVAAAARSRWSAGPARRRATGGPARARTHSSLHYRRAPRSGSAGTISLTRTPARGSSDWSSILNKWLLILSNFMKSLVKYKMEKEGERKREREGERQRERDKVIYLKYFQIDI